jgi:hypothetical protein
MGPNNAAANLIADATDFFAGGGRRPWWGLPDQDTYRAHSAALASAIGTQSAAATAALRLLDMSDTTWSDLDTPFDSPERFSPDPTAEAMDYLRKSIEKVQVAHTHDWICHHGPLRPADLIVATVASPDDQVFTVRMPDPMSMVFVRPNWDATVAQVQRIMLTWFEEPVSWVLAHTYDDSCRCGHRHEDHIPAVWRTPAGTPLNTSTMTTKCGSSEGCDCVEYVSASPDGGQSLRVFTPQLN